jgi:hypothetical protein
MSGTFPTNPKFQAVNFSINTPTLTSESISGKKRRVGMGHSFYSFSAKFSNVTSYNMGPVLGFVAAQYGQLDNFSIVLPEISYSKNTTLGSITVTTSGAKAIGDNSVTLGGGFSPGDTFLLAGDFIKFSNHSKVYMVTADWVYGQPLFFSGSLVSAVPSGTQIIFNAVPFNVILDNDVQQFDVGMGGITTMQLDMREVW